MSLSLGREEGFRSIGRYRAGVRVFHQDRTLLIDVPPPAGCCDGELVGCGTCDRAIFGVEIANVLVAFPFEVGTDEGKARYGRKPRAGKFGQRMKVEVVDGEKNIVLNSADVN